MMKKIYLLACVLLLADVSFGRGCLEGFNNVAVFNTKQVGDIIVSRGGTDDIFISRERFIVGSNADNALMNTIRIRITACTHNITREVQAGANIDIPFADINAGRNRVVNANLVIEQGYVIRLADGQMAYWDVLRALPRHELQNILNAMRRGSRFSLVTQLVYVERGHTTVTWQNNVNFALNATAGRTEGGALWSRTNDNTIQITYDSATPTSVGFISMPISRRDIRRIIGQNLYSAYSNHIYLTLGNGVTHGSAVGLNAATRYGLTNNIGLGLQGSFGAGRESNFADYIHWSAGAKFYPFRYLFVSVNYGTFGLQETSQQNTNDGHFTFSGAARPRMGFSYLAGINLLSSNRDVGGVRMVLSAAGGFFHHNNQLTPVWSIGIGIGNVRL